jgi:cytochrome c oxidase assembly factor CtaG
MSARRALVGVGLAIVLAAQLSPLDRLGDERLFSAHMLQHVAIADLGPLLVALGFVGGFRSPRLGPLRMRGAPVAVLLLWAADLGLWHVPSLYESALAHEGIHALQHVLLFVLGFLVWGLVVGALTAPAWFTTGWRAVSVIVLNAFAMALANVFVWAPTPVYDTYAEAPRTWGLSAVADQRLAAVVMLVEGTVVALAAFTWLFLRWLAESERRQALADRPGSSTPLRAGTRAARPEGGERLARSSAGVPAGEALEESGRGLRRSSGRR